MIFVPGKLSGTFVVELDRREDSRGHFARIWCQREFAKQGLETRLAQCSLSFNHRRGTLRGMHWQAPPHGEVKLVRCTRGAIWDVVIDLRAGSPTYGQHLSLELTAESGRSLYVPQGFAHGFVTLVDETEVLYQISEFYEPGAARGIRWDDPAFHISWPVANPILHPRDAAYPDFEPAPAP